MHHNDWTLVGRLTKAPDLRYLDSGKAVAQIRLAVSRGVKDADGKEQTDFFDCVAWEKTAEFLCNNGGRGRLLLLQGQARTRQVKRVDGSEYTKVELVVARSQFMDPKPPVEKASADD